MNKAIMLSLQGKWGAKIANGKKIIELRKDAPKDWKEYLDKKTDKLPAEIEVFMYITQQDDIARLSGMPNDEFVCDCYPMTEEQFKRMKSGYSAKGKVIGKFTLRKVDKIMTCLDGACRWFFIRGDKPTITNADVFNYGWDLKKKSACEFNEIECYFENKIGTSYYETHRTKYVGYAWHIEDLVIFDKPIELKEFYPYCKDKNCIYRKYHCSICYREPLRRAPQSWCYCEMLRDAII